MAPPRIYLTGHVAVEYGSTLVDERHLAGRQGRLAFAYLIAHRATPVSRDRLLEVIWRETPPPEVETALSAILSKLRGALKKAQFDEAGIDLRMGAVRVRLPADVRIDMEEAANAIDMADGCWRQRDGRGAWANANVAVAIGRRPFLADEEAPWIAAPRERLRAMLSRGLQILTTVSLENGESELAVQHANDLVALDPFRETSYQQLMRLHARMGNRGEALRVFSRLRELLRDELGTSPSPQSEAIFLEILTA
ncbi:MAG TPA: BTAD domain-containing putative transcriptional regulator [Vicinamibacterales bacterium]|nr:BTAD domain-containing putative transcriptional regulator [Vicinamibacterales bacterium]